MRSDECFNAVGGGVETPGYGGELVAGAGTRGTSAASPRRLHALRSDPAAREKTHDRIGSRADNRGNHGEIGEGAAPNGTEIIFRLAGRCGP